MLYSRDDQDVGHGRLQDMESLSINECTGQGILDGSFASSFFR